MDKEKRHVVGVAWHDAPGESFAAVCKAIEKAGGTPVRLGQIFSGNLDYDENGMLVGLTDRDGALSMEAADRVKRNTWHDSNTEAVMKGINAVVFPGGGDMSPALFRGPEPVKTTEGFSAERDVSDYILMSYCLEKDIPVLAICRGMQVLAVVSGARMIQDIPDYLEGNGKKYDYMHRNEPAEPGGYRDFSFHDVSVTGEDSILYRLTGMKTIPEAPSWHHQAAASVENTLLAVTGVTETAGEELIEVIERRDKSFVLGLQYHPEIAVVRELDDISLVYFSEIVRLADCRGNRLLREPDLLLYKKR